jgi:hypothetical protein
VQRIGYVELARIPAQQFSRHKLRLWLAGFQCGVNDLNGCLRRDAARTVRLGSSRWWVRLGMPEIRELGMPQACAPWRFPARPPPSRPQGHRAPPRLPQAGQMAHRLRRPDQLPQTPLRLGPHPPGQQNGNGDLVRARGIRPQPSQDRGTRRLTRARQTPAPAKDSVHPQDSNFFRSK